MKKPVKKSINKSQAIRDALQTYPNVSPAAIAERVSAQLQTKITPAYVSIVKYNQSKAARVVPVKSAARHIKPTKVSSNQAWTALANLVKSAGGVDTVREMLGTIELIKNTL